MTTFAKSQTPFGRPAFSWTLATSQKSGNLQSDVFIIILARI
jgi:hypothetical protein